METGLRKYTDNMRISAFGVILFGLWSILKCIMYLVFDTGVFDMVDIYDDGSEILRVVVIVITFFILVVDLIFRLIVATSAIRDSKKGDKGLGYIILGSFMFIMYAVILIAGFFNADYYGQIELIIDGVVTVIVDITSLYAIGDLIYSSIMAKSLRKKTAQQEAD